MIKKVIAVFLSMLMLLSMLVVSVSANEVDVASDVTSSVETVVEETSSAQEDVDVSSNGDDAMIPYEPEVTDASSDVQDVVEENEDVDNAQGDSENAGTLTEEPVVDYGKIAVKFQISGVTNNTSVSFKVNGNESMTVVCDAASGWSSTVALPVGEYAIEKLKGDNNKYSVTTSLKSFVINNKSGHTITIDMTETQKENGFLSFFKNNALILIVIVGAYIGMVICAKKRQGKAN